MLLQEKNSHLQRAVGRVLIRFIVCFNCFWVVNAHAASDFYEAFNFKKCLYYLIDNEPHGIALSKESAEYMAAYRRANEHPNSLYKIKSLQALEQLSEEKTNKLVKVYSGAVKGKNGLYISQYGACYGSTTVGLSCLPGQKFPLSGASYRLIPSKGELKTFACTTGCDDAPDFIYDMGYENMDGERNIEHEAAMRKFRNRCGKGIL